MKKMYVWEIDYQVSGLITTTRSVKVVSATDSYGEAEQLALNCIKEELKDSNFNYDFISNISPSQIVYAAGDSK